MKFQKLMPKALSAAMAMTILLSGVSVASYSAGAESAAPAAKTDGVKTEAKAETAQKTDKKKAEKTETVYVIAKPDGTPRKVIVSDWIKNASKSQKLVDKSNLSEIKNLKGDESYSVNEKGMLEWGANGNDIYYQGKSDKELPVGVSVKFTLDGKAVSPSELEGKSGKVVMRFDYTNRQSEKVKIDGKEQEIYVPFVMLTGMLLDNAKFSNVEISNGKVVNDGTHTYVAGFALPGLKKSLGIDSDKLDLPESVEITADVESFELSTTLTVATSELFGELDTDKLDDKLDDLESKLDDLSKATAKLVDGSSELYKGISTLLDKSGELIDGVNQLYSGAEQLKNGSASLSAGAQTLAGGAADLDKGAGTLAGGADALDSGAAALDSGAAELDNGVASLQGYVAQLAGGLDTIDGNSAQLCSGAKQVFDTLLATADKQIAASGLSAEPLTTGNYSKVLSELIASLSDENAEALANAKAREAVTAAVTAQRNVIAQAVENEVRKQVTAGVLSASGFEMSADEYDAAVAAGQIPEEAQAQIAAAVSTQMTAMQSTIESNTEAQVQALIEQQMNSDEVREQIAAGVAQASAGRTSLSTLKEQLDSYNTFYQGVIAYTAGVNQANAGAQQILGGTYTLKDGTKSLSGGADELKNGTGALKSGTKELKSGSSKLSSGAKELSDGAKTLDSGMGTLFDGIATLKDGSSALVSGVKQLYDGSMQLSDGMKKYKEEGIDAILDAYNGDVKSFINRVKAIKKVAQNYKSFSGISDDMDGKVNFIIKTDGIGTDAED